jgi:hypothetical protein
MIKEIRTDTTEIRFIRPAPADRIGEGRARDADRAAWLAALGDARHVARLRLEGRDVHRDVLAILAGRVVKLARHPFPVEWASAQAQAGANVVDLGQLRMRRDEVLHSQLDRGRQNLGGSRCVHEVSPLVNLFLMVCVRICSSNSKHCT